jgi:DtxR family Mn-dependent transcriptional regulator
MPSSTVEDYLKCIYHEQHQHGHERVSTGSIATALGVTPGTATAMIKTLHESGLILYEPYNGVQLTPEGHRLATHVLRRHRVLELFLVQVMGMDWTDVHKEAEVLEHAVSDRLLERMYEMLGEPAVDPHGDPIPDAGGEVHHKSYPTLLECELKVPLRLVRVTDQGVDFLRLLKGHGLRPGEELQVAARREEADSVELSTCSDTFSLGFRAASKILVEATVLSRQSTVTRSPASGSGESGFPAQSQT